MAQRRYRAQTAADIEEMYKELLDELKAMPRDTREAREARQKLVNGYEQLNELVQDLLNAYKPSAYQRLLSHLGYTSADMDEKKGAEEDDEDYEEAEGSRASGAYYGGTQDSMKNRLWESTYTDPSTLYEALLSASAYYTGKSKEGEPVSFLAAVGKQFRQIAGTQYAKESTQLSGLLPPSKEDHISTIYKLARNVRELKESGAYVSFEKALDSLTLAPWISGSIKKTILLIANGQHETTALDYVINSDGVDTTVGELLADGRDEYSDLIEKEAMSGDLRDFFLYWDKLGALYKKREKDCLRLFLTRDILKPLKTDSMGNPFPEEPAGEQDVYDALSPYESVVYGKIFYKEYVDYAVTGSPEDLYDVYANLLRKGFRFTDKELADALGRDKSWVSKKRTLYQSLQARMRDYCYSIRQAE